MNITGLSYSLVSCLTRTAFAADAGDDVQGKTATVHKAELFDWQPAKKGLNVKASWMREILRANGAEEKEVEYKLLDMTWQMLAKAIAKEVYGIEIDDAKADELAKILQKDNGGLDKPAKILGGLEPLTGGEKVQSMMSYKAANQFNVYRGKVESRGKSVQWGRFPLKLPVNISVEFANTVNWIPAQAAEQPQQTEPVSDNGSAAKAPAESGCKWFKVQIAVFKPKSMAFKLVDKLDPLLKEMNEDLKAYVLDNGNGLWCVYVGEFSKNEVTISSQKDAEQMLTDLTKILQGKPDLSELKPFIKSDDQCGLSIETPEEPARSSSQFFKVWVGTFMDKGRVDNVSSQLRAKGFEAYVRKFDGGVYLVQAGAFIKQGNAETMLRDIKDRLCEDPGSDLCKLEPVIKQPRSINKEDE